MKTKVSTISLSLTVLSLALTVVLLATTAWAATLTWDGGTGAWNTTNTNWLDGGSSTTWTNVPPDSAVFGAGGTGTETVTLGEDIAIEDITFQSGAVHTITGSNTLTLHGTHSSGYSYITLAAGQQATIDANISSVYPLRLFGSGGSGEKLILTHANSFTQRLIPDTGGVLSLRHNDAAGSADYVFPLANSAVEVQDGVTIDRILYLGYPAGGPDGKGDLRSVSGNNEWSGEVRIHSARPNGTIGVDAGSLTVSGQIRHYGGSSYIDTLTKVGNGTLILTNANTYTGTTTVNAGVLKITNASALGTTAGGTTVASGAQLRLEGGLTFDAEPLTISGNGSPSNPTVGRGALNGRNSTNVWTGPITVAGTGEAYITATGGHLTISGGVTGTNARLRLDQGANTVTGNPIDLGTGGYLSVNSTSLLSVAGNTFGTLRIDWNGNFRMGVANALPANVTVVLGSVSTNPSAGKGKLDLNGYDQTIGMLKDGSTQYDTEIVTNSQATAATLSINQSAASTYLGTITGNLALVKSGSATTTLGGTNTYTGTTDVNAGVLHITSNTALGDTSAGTTITTGSAKLYLSGDISVAEPITFAGGQANPNSLLNVSGTNTLSGPITTGSVRIVANSGSTLNITGGITGTNPFFVVNSNGEINFSTNPVNLGSGYFWADSGGLTVLGVSGNTWGTTTFSNGTMRMDAANALPTNTNFKIGGISYGRDYSLLDLNGFSQTVGRLDRAGTTIEEIAITSATPATFTANQSATTNYEGGFTGAVALTKTGSGTLNLSGVSAPTTNRHTGDTLLTGGTLALGNVDLLQNSTLDTGPSGAQAVTFTAAGTNTYNLGGLKGADDLAIGANSINVGANNQDTSYSGVLGGSGSLTKAGSGTLNLSGDNIYTGPTTISAGTLQVGGSIDSDVTIDGGWLTGNGQIDGSVTIGSSGSISAGASPGQIDILGAYDQSGTMLVEINGYDQGTNPGYDYIDVTGTATLDGTIAVDLLDGFAPVEGDTFDVLTATGGITDLGIQVSWTPGQLSPVYYWTHEIVNGDTLRLTARVPEPSTFLLTTLGLIGLTLFGRRRKR